VTVQRGETLSAIASRAGVSVSALAAANGIDNPNRVRSGQTLNLPGSGGGTVVASSGGVVVHSGDTLSSIAARAGVTTAALASANGITDANLVRIGQTLRLPSGGTSVSVSSAGSTTVRPGETLSAIATRSGVSISALAQANGISNPNLVRVGQALKIPAGGSGPVASSGTSRSEVGNLIAQAAARHGVDPSLARAIAWQESGWNQSMRSNVGAIGVMQLMPETATWVGPSLLGRSINAHDLRDNVDGGVAYLAWLNRHAGSDATTIAGYYQGLASVRRIGLYDDTKQYIRSVQALRGRV
jgi:N-acetylmuramoyl-L-alanine amidase